MKLGTVVGVYLSDDTYENFNSITVSLRDRGSKNLLRCTPLDTNSRKIPVIGEQVYVLVGNSDEASGASNSTKNYYLSTVGIQNNVNHNALPKLTKAEGSSVPNFGQVSNGIPAQSSTDSPNDLGIGFEEVSNLSQLQPFIGDVIHEGRFGQSIRFGYTPQGTKGSDNRIKGVVTEPSWKSTDPKSPITIIRNGAGESRGYNKFVIEDINKDDSSIWLGSKQTIGLTPSNSFTLGVTPTNLYKNPQIVLNSDRIVLNSKSDSVLISGDKSVNVSTPNWKADMDVIFSQLESITDALLQLAPAITAATAGPFPVPSLATAGPQLLSTITQVKTQLTLMKQ
jgi:hypothetical protein